MILLMVLLCSHFMIEITMIRIIKQERPKISKYLMCQIVQELSARSGEGDLLRLRVHARFSLHRVVEKVATLPTCPYEHHKVR